MINISGFRSRYRRLVWPVPAVLVWGVAWLVFRLATGQGIAVVWAIVLATTVGVAMSLLGNSWWRRAMIALGFPVSWAMTLPALGGNTIPAWVWLLVVVLLLLVYPVNAWRDAPLFPTPPDALRGLPALAPLVAGALVLDAGCGVGHGLMALRRAYPKAQWHGLEWSWPLRWLCALRCPWAQVRRGDIWQADWTAYDMVYLFQRPESMPRAVAKARKELRPGSWLVSLEFAAAELTASARYSAPGGKMVWLYRAPFIELSGE